MKEIGNKLRQARTNKNLTIQDVATAIKVNVKTLESIEEGNLDNLPAKPFLRGFVQAYAKYLGLDVDDIMAQFLELQGSTRPRPMTTEELSQVEQSNHEEIQKRVDLYKKIAYVVVAILALSLIYSIQRIVRRYEAESQSAKMQKEAVLSQMNPSEPPVPAQEKPQESPSSTPSPETDNKKDSAPTTKELPKENLSNKPDVKKEDVSPTKLQTPPSQEIKKEEPKTEPVAAKTAAPEIKKDPVPLKESPKETPTNKTDTKKEEPKKEEGSPATGKTHPQEVIMEALDNVEIRYSKDGEKEKSIRLKPEQVFILKATSQLTLQISDGGAVNLSHNGKDKGVPGSLGKPTKISYP